MTGVPDLSLAVGFAVSGVAVLRLAWGRPRRSHALNAAGWGLLLAGGTGGAGAAGAWGVSVAALWAMGAAFAALAWAGLTAPEGRATASNRRVGLLPEGAEPLRLGARALTFAIVALLCAFVAVGVALGVGALLRWCGVGAANANAAALFTTPLAWAGLAYAVLMQPRRSGQAKALALGSLPAWPALIAGVLA